MNERITHVERTEIPTSDYILLRRAIMTATVIFENTYKKSGHVISTNITHHDDIISEATVIFGTDTETEISQPTSIQSAGIVILNPRVLSTSTLSNDVSTLTSPLPPPPVIPNLPIPDRLVIPDVVDVEPVIPEIPPAPEISISPDLPVPEDISEISPRFTTINPDIDPALQGYQTALGQTIANSISGQTTPMQLSMTALAASVQQLAAVVAGVPGGAGAASVVGSIASIPMFSGLPKVNLPSPRNITEESGGRIRSSDPNIQTWEVIIMTDNVPPANIQIPIDDILRNIQSIPKLKNPVKILHEVNAKQKLVITYEFEFPKDPLHTITFVTNLINQMVINNYTNRTLNRILTVT